MVKQTAWLAFRALYLDVSKYCSVGETVPLLEETKKQL